MTVLFVAYYEFAAYDLGQATLLQRSGLILEASQ